MRLQPPYTSPPHNPDDPTRADVVVLAATDGEWRTIRTWSRSMGARWPHEVAMSVLVHMRYLADAAFNDAQWATLAGADRRRPAPRTPPCRTRRRVRGPRRAPRAPDALAELIDAGLAEVGEQLVWNGHTATIRDGGVVHDGGPHEFAVSTVTALATSLAGYTVNGWHLWRRARDDRPLSDLRTALTTR